MMSQKVAHAIASVSLCAGQSYDASGSQSVEERAANLLRENGAFGAYIREGDPSDWGEGHALATIYMEPIGGTNDCIVPIDYYGASSFDVAARASEILGDCYIEFINAAVACVFRD